MTTSTTVITKGHSSVNFYQEVTFDIEITPSKLTALFLEVNKSSLHPQISSWTKNSSQKSEQVMKNNNKKNHVHTISEGRFFRIYSSASSSHSDMSYMLHFHKTLMRTGLLRKKVHPCYFYEIRTDLLIHYQCWKDCRFQ